jgi:hypothetical protein
MSACSAANRDDKPCGRPASKSEAFCLAHSPDPARKAEHAEISRLGGESRWLAGVRANQVEIRAIIRRVDEGELDNDTARTLFAGHRIVRDYESDARNAAALDEVYAKLAALAGAIEAQ